MQSYALRSSITGQLLLFLFLLLFLLLLLLLRCHPEQREGSQPVFQSSLPTQAIYAALVSVLNSRFLSLVMAALLVASFISCKSASEQAIAEARQRVGGDPTHGLFLIQRYGCGGCHRIPGVIGAAGKAAPSLEHLPTEPYISGNLPNSPENVMRWIESPHSVLPRTKMPETGMSHADARDITTYLWSLR